VIESEDCMPFKLGKRAPKAHKKTLSFEKYAGDALPVAPSKIYWSYKVPESAWGMLGNDVRGNCVIASAMHMDMNWTAHTGKMSTYTTDQATELYDRLSPDDSGLVITDFLNLWQTEGMYDDPIDGGHAIPFFNAGALGRKCVTWGKLQPALNPWLDLYTDESYAVISESWFDTTTGLAPSHFNRDLLWADLKKL
jgi:hypothetical protein